MPPLSPTARRMEYQLRDRDGGAHPNAPPPAPSDKDVRPLERTLLRRRRRAALRRAD